MPPGQWGNIRAAFIHAGVGAYSIRAGRSASHMELTRAPPPLPVPQTLRAPNYAPMLQRKADGNPDRRNLENVMGIEIGGFSLRSRVTCCGVASGEWFSPNGSTEYLPPSLLTHQGFTSPVVGTHHWPRETRSPGEYAITEKKN